MDLIRQLLNKDGPTRSSRIAELLHSEFALTAVAARKRVSRVAAPVRRFPVPLLPKRESFLYLQDDRNTEQFWTSFQRDLRETGSVFGIAVDALIARGGLVRNEDFPVISGAPIAQKGQVAAQRVAERLVSAGFLEEVSYDDCSCLRIKPYSLGSADLSGFRARLTAEAILLDSVREWARKLGLASYNKISIRGDKQSRQVGAFLWDLSGPSYLLPFQRAQAQPGFFVADVFAEGILDEHQIQFFIRKARMLKATLKGGGILPLLVAEGFSGPALTAGHEAGVVLATPTTLFGARVGAAVRSLMETLKHAAAIASTNPTRIAQLVDDLAGIEGAAGNLRGVLFNLIAAHLARRDAVSIDIGVRARNDAGETADIDVLKITNQAAACVAIECKGKRPGGLVPVEEVQEWMRRIPIVRAHLSRREDLREADTSFELWTSGTFHPDSLALLKAEKPKRTKARIDWKDGEQVLALAKAGKEKAITNALHEHFLRHPLAKASEAAAVNAAA